MNVASLVIKNLFNGPLVCFLIGAVIPSFFKKKNDYKTKFNYEIINKILTIYILFSIGTKGGSHLIHHFSSSNLSFLGVLSSLVLWGFLQPCISFYILKNFIKVDGLTAAAISASFGSVSVMTFVAALSFLEQLKIGYEESMIATLAMMEIPAIISGLLLAKILEKKSVEHPLNILKMLRELLCNQAVVSLLLGLLIGIGLNIQGMRTTHQLFLKPFQPLLCLFMLGMGLRIGSHKTGFFKLSWRLNLFGIYMPLIGAAFGLLLSYWMHLDPGTATLVTVLAASASYIAAPAAMRVCLPQANEAIYLPLSLCITFPFNVILGIPFYYYLVNLLRHTPH